ncbi:MAG: hypothetical protein ACR2HX_21495 [Pyrinomonadaceae bacterium]
MILSMSGFFLSLAILGGFTILLSDPKARASNQMPIGFSMMFGGFGYCSLALVLYPLAFQLGTATGFALLFFAPFIGGLVGGMFGYRTGLKRRATTQA